MTEENLQPDEFEESFNPTVRGNKRMISKIIRCPRARSKISISKCKKCPNYQGISSVRTRNGERNESIICSYSEKNKSKTI